MFRRGFEGGRFREIKFIRLFRFVREGEVWVEFSFG